MSRAPAACRMLALLFGLSGLFGVFLSLCALPAVAEDWILADGDIHSKRTRFLFYGVAVAGLVASSACIAGARALWRRAARIDAVRFRRAMIALACSLAGSLALFEIGLRSFVPVERVLSREALRYRDWEKSDWNSAERKYMPSITVDPELGWAPRPGFRSDGESVNSAGFRGRTEYAVARPEHGRRILLVGDSFTWCERTWSAVLRDEDTFGSVLERRLHDAEVMNLGVSGYGSDQALLRLERLGVRYSPDVVVLGIYSEDLDRNLFRFHTYAKPYFALDGDELRLCGAPIPDERQVRAEWEPSLKPGLFTWSLVHKAWDQALDRTRFAPKWHLSERILDRCAATIGRCGARMVLLHFPPESDLGRADAAELHLRRWAASNGVPFVALREAFAAVPAAERGRIYDGHLTPFGNSLVADALLSILEREHMVDAR